MMSMKKLAVIVTSFLFLQLISCSPAPSPAPTPTPVPEDVPLDIPDDTDTVPVPVFSKEGGFYSAAFKLSLSSEDGTTIYYTTDGTDPRTSKTSQKYTNEIKIYDNTKDRNVYSAITDISLNGYQPPDFKVDKGINIRAAVRLSDGTYGPVVTNSYFIAKNASYYKEFGVISMVTDADYLFDPDTGAYMVGTGYYKWKRSSDYVAYDPGDVQNPTNYNADGRESEFPVTIQVFKSGNAVYTTDVGARISGNWSRAGAQKSFRFYARKEYGDSKMRYAFIDDLTNSEGSVIEKFDKFTLRNGGNDHILHFRDAFIQDLVSERAVDIMASEPYILFLNGEFWGFYLLREKPEAYYIQSHYGIDENAVTVIKNSDIESGSYDVLDEYREFCHWASTADMTVEANYQKFCEQMDVQSFMDYIAIETYVSNSDWATGYLNNWMVWRSEIIDPSLPKADKKWRFILYDLDFTSGLYGSEGTSVYNDLLGQLGAEGHDYNFPDMLKNLCRNKDFLNAFYNNYLSVIDNCFSIDKVKTKLSAYTNTYREATQATLHRFGLSWAAYSYDGEADGLLNFFKNRPTYAKKYLDIFCGRTDTGTPSAKETKVLKPSQWWYWGGATFEVDYANEVFHAHVPKTLANSWEAQAGAGNLTFEEGHRYRITFEASCNGNGTFELFVNREDNGSYPTVNIADFTFTKELTAYECTFVMTMGTNDDWSLCFNFGEGKGDFVLQNVTVSEVN